MYGIRFLPVARQDIEDAYFYIRDELHAPKAAADLLNTLEHSIATLSEFPYLHPVYRPIKPLKAEYRMLPVDNYLVFYCVFEQAKQVEIQRVIYSKMDLQKTFRGI